MVIPCPSDVTGMAERANHGWRGRMGVLRVSPCSRGVDGEWVLNSGFCCVERCPPILMRAAWGAARGSFRSVVDYGVQDPAVPGACGE
jgi:hypothetical protein